LDENPNGVSFPAVANTLKEVYRILKPGGVLTITTITPEQFDANWFSNLVPENKQRWHKRLPRHSQLKSYLEESGFFLRSALTSLMASYHPEHGNLEGPLSESWRENVSFWGTCTESEIQEMVKKVKQMKEEGTLQEYYETHEKIDTFGAFEILAAVKEMK
jgi:predicted SAM-dependent methyltransferase